MQIALIGYGKMGHTIEEVALERGHHVVCVVDKDNQEAFESEAFASADVVIEFTTPSTAEANILRSWSKGKPVVCGTTGWDVEGFVSRNAEEIGAHALLWSSNYSVGVNILFELNRRLASIMSKYPDYQPSISEVHHVHKLDAPSGTAKTLAAQMCLSPTPPITSIREGEVPGIHTVTWDSAEDTLSIRHSAKSRKGFAKGAVLGAEWLIGKKGFFDFSDVLGLHDKE